jgi:hypothetical protein
MSGSAGWLACEQLSLLFELGLVDLAPGETLLQDIDRRPPASLPAKSGATKTAPRAMVAKAEEAHQDQSWPGESGQGNKWNFCLKAARIAADQERA